MGLIHFVGFDTEVYYYYSDKVLEVVYFLCMFGLSLEALWKKFISLNSNLVRHWLVIKENSFEFEIVPRA